MSLTAASRRTPRRTRLAAATIALPVALGAVLTGCSSGQITQTAEKRPGVEGAHSEIGDIKIKNAHFVAPEEGKYEAGDMVPLEMYVVATGKADEITSITVDGKEATISSSGESASSGASSSGAASSSAAPSSGAATSSASAGSSSIEIPADGKVYFSEDGGDATIEAPMPEEAYTSALIPVTITFKNAGELEFEVPVAASLDEIERDENQKYTPSEGAGEHG